MTDVTRQQALMQLLVHLYKEVILTAVNGQCQVAVGNLVQLIDHRMFVPQLLIVRICTQLHSHLPVLREGTDVYPTTHAAGRTEHILMTDG